MRSGEVRRVVELGRQARSTRGIKLRQPLRQAVVYGADVAAVHVGEIADELRVKEVRFETEAGRVRLKPNLPVLGPRLGPKLPAVRAALQEGRYELRDGAVVVEGERLGPGDVIQERERSPRGGRSPPTATSASSSTPSWTRRWSARGASST